ncbi:MAG: hypothetical protein ACR2FF_04410 [Mycobacteriales bacterium]|nr:MAG: hypothetical protein DLM56_14215 [Pseudonocardiales bacterium]
MLIECDRCAMRDIACDDCVVSVLLATPAVRAADGSPAVPAAAPDFDDAEQVALVALADGGLVPPLRLLPITAREATWTQRRRSPDELAG